MTDRPHMTDESSLDAVRSRSSMEDIAKQGGPQVATPDEAITALKRGNARFFSGQTTQQSLGVNERRALIMSQTPFAIVLGCSDSRVPTEMIFDQGFGDIFSIRLAGNVASGAALGSVEYAVKHLKCRLLVVMGHEGCGAVKAAMLGDEVLAEEPENVRLLVERIRPALRGMPRIRDEKARMREAVISNVRSQVALLRENPVVQRATQAGSLKVIGAFYEIGSGAVDFLISDEDLAVE
ncbi:carbonic anhydrase [Deinococcus peraridilitoris]|uniref:Carbonic anhydrase n=1 Tax=Deinococcus peraridilitoris (strain DSM 19664 / LMG 22246 / CIP 109416 / KR-200) TaxID=937777 RepID=L0A2A4_DEIPD|nr:carbonic anhydrase [Deinococcus peraridilitoris]AFZ68033.1 carbonic anhydrase [Deinococcus peraridilitoris DSM 19664]